MKHILIGYGSMKWFTHNILENKIYNNRLKLCYIIHLKISSPDFNSSNIIHNV
jgi:hypothetical protein